MDTLSSNQQSITVHFRNLLVGTIGSAVVVTVQKGGVDLFLPILLGWFVLSIFSIQNTHNAKNFVMWNIILIVADSILDVFAMGLHFPHWIHAPLVLPWRSASPGQSWTIIYWIFLWGIAVPNRTLALLDRVKLGHSKIVLFVAVIGLHVTFVEDVIYFALLGYLPFVSTPPLNYDYLPHLFGIHWTAQYVWLMSEIGCAFYVLAAIVALVDEKLMLRNKKETILERTV